MVATAPPAAATIPPTNTPTPEVKTLIYIDRLSAWDNLREEFSEKLQSLAKQYDLSFTAFKEVPDFAALDTAALVVVLGGDREALDTIQSGSSRKLLVVGVPNATPGDHSAVIGSEGMRQDQTAFLSGYISALVTDNWRVGILGVDESGVGQAELEGYLNGVVFFCGLCRPAYPPFETYPTSFTVQSPSMSDLLGGVDQLIEQAVSTIGFSHALDPLAIHPILSAHTESRLLWIGPVAPQEDLRQRWIGTVRPAPEDALEDVIARLMNGESSIAVPMPIDIFDINSAILTEGKLRMVLEIRDEIVLGIIDTGINPLLGQERK